MLSSFGFERVITNVFKLSCGRPGGDGVGDTDQLRDFYLDFLQDIYPGIPINRSKDPFIHDAQYEAQLADAFTMDAAMGNADQKAGFIGEGYAPDVHTEKIDFARAALDTLLARDDDLRAIFELVVHSVIIRQSKSVNGRITHSSSSGTAVGVIWLSLVDGLSRQDVQELFVHELTHQLLFIDDFVHSQFQYKRMSESDNHALTAVSLSHRPLDIVIHSIVVAAEILVARQELLGEPEQPKVHPPTASMLPTIASSYASVRALHSYDTLVTDHIGEILSRSLRQVAAIGCEVAS